MGFTRCMLGENGNLRSGSVVQGPMEHRSRTFSGWLTCQLRAFSKTSIRIELCAQVWLALFAAVLGTTMAYHLLNYSSPFGEFDTVRLRRSTQASNQVKTYVVESRESYVILPCWAALGTLLLRAQQAGTRRGGWGHAVLEQGQLSACTEYLGRQAWRRRSQRC